MLKKTLIRILYGIIILFWVTVTAVIADNGNRTPISQTGDSSHLTVVRLGHDLFSVQAMNIPLKQVLEELAKQIGAKIVFNTATDEIISADLSNLHMEEILKRLTRGFARVFLYQPSKAKTGSMEIKKVVLYGEVIRNLKNKNNEIMAKNMLLQGITPSPQEGQLHNLLNAPDPGFRLKAVDILARSEDETAVDYLSELLLNDENGVVRAGAAEALGDLDNRKGIPALKRALEEKDTEIRLNALVALGNFGDENITMDLVPFLADSHHDIRTAVIMMLRDLGGKKAVELITRALDDKDAGVREAARVTLAEMKEAEKNDFPENTYPGGIDTDITSEKL